MARKMKSATSPQRPVNTNAKRANRNNPREDRNTQPENNGPIFSKKKAVLLPRNLAQEKFCDELESDKTILICTGSPGSGKTYLTLVRAVQALQNNEISKIILCRAAVTVDNEEHGFLPGSMTDKLRIFAVPAFDVLKLYYSPVEIERMLLNETIELAPLSHMRGRNLGGEMGDVYVVADECQNLLSSQILMLTTRINGEGSRIFLLGDTKQHDRGHTKSGILDFVERIESRGGHPDIGICHFTPKDVVRHPIITDILKMYGQE